MQAADSGAERFIVLVNSEEQYSLWREGMKIPDGWRATGPAGERQLCLDYIESVWTDMRPASLRESMARQAEP